MNENLTCINSSSSDTDTTNVSRADSFIEYVYNRVTSDESRMNDMENKINSLENTISRMSNEIYNLGNEIFCLREQMLTKYKDFVSNISGDFVKKYAFVD